MGTEKVRYVRVRNWRKFQHYHKRGAPWIKLYDELNSHESANNWLDLTARQRGELATIWLLAKERGNVIAMHGEIHHEVGLSEPIDIESLAPRWIEIHSSYHSCASKSASDFASENAMGEGEGEREGDVLERDIKNSSNTNQGVASGSPADPSAARAKAREKQNQERLRQWEEWVQSLKGHENTPDEVVDDFVAELEACVEQHYEGRSGSFTPARKATFATRMGRLGFDPQMFAIEVYCDSNAGKSDERYCIGIARRLAKADDKEIDRQMDRHRRAHKGTGLNARAGRR